MYVEIPQNSGATNARLVEGLGVAASIDSNQTWMLQFQMPPTLPSGTAKLKLRAVANATAEVAAEGTPSVQAVCAVEETYDTITLTGEGTQTITWGSGDADQFKELEVTLDADTIVADEIVIMNLVFETTDWTLAQVSTWIASIIWE